MNFMVVIVQVNKFIINDGANLLYYQYIHIYVLIKKNETEILARLYLLYSFLVKFMIKSRYIVCSISKLVTFT